MAHTLEHFSYTQDANRIVWLTFDRKDSSVNTLNEAVLKEFHQVLERVRLEAPHALVIRSGKSSGFIAGADISQFKNLSNTEEAALLIRKAQALFQELDDLPCITIALIQGFCLGGGLELALACDYRIAETSANVRLGLPEVKLGIHPGWGGSVRLPALIGASAAFDLILTGRLVRADAARKMGFVDAAVPKRLIDKVTLEFALTPPPKMKPSWLARLSNQVPLRVILGALMRKQVAKKARIEHYPAPFAVIDNWVYNGVSGMRPYEVEALSIAKLMVSSTAQSLVHIFFLQERLKGQAKKSPHKIEHIHVIGAGVMGGDIAAWSAYRGFTVTLQDQSPQFLESALKRAYQLAEKRLKEPSEIRAMMDRLIPDVAGHGVKRADIIIEAITEKLEAKQALFKALEPKLKEGAVLATNTSTIPLEEIRTVLKRPERLVGIHYFNPVALMPLVEVVKAEGVDTDALEKAMAFVKQSDKLPLVVKSAPGFMVNRILLPYMQEAVTLLEEGVSGPDIDEAAKRFGMPMGPIELADKVGLDICLAVLEKMSVYFGGTVPEGLKALVAEKKLGEKTGQGFYRYKNGKIIKGKPSRILRADIAERLTQRLCTEALAVLKEGIVEDEDLLDAGSVFGFGFPPFRGGIMRYIHTV
jgi:3-hydroxyacyl-CoA dehydrogenase/enoyl-CoA hydratase/3-hydroxybutyryl-CoA epimerase